MFPHDKCHSSPVRHTLPLIKKDMNTEAVYDLDDETFDPSPGLTPEEQYQIFKDIDELNNN